MVRLRRVFDTGGCQEPLSTACLERCGQGARCRWVDDEIWARQTRWGGLYGGRNERCMGGRTVVAGKSAVVDDTWVEEGSAPAPTMSRVPE